MTEGPTRHFGAVEDARQIDGAAMTNREAALTYAKLGWKVFPVYEMRKDGTCSCGKDACKDAGKHPRTGAQGHLKATSDRKQIASWWQDYPRANIGLSCRASGIVAIDIDVPRTGKKSSKDGRRPFAALEAKHGSLRPVLEALSGGGGRHLLFAAPEWETAPKFGEGIDTKYNGYILVWPSNHVTGGRYKWLPGRGPFDGDYETLGGLGTLPATILALGSKSHDTEQPPGGHDNVLPDLAFSDLQELLTFVPNEDVDYDQWIEVGAAIHCQTRGSTEGAALFHDWSAHDGRYDKGKTEKSWRSFGKTLAGKLITARTILKKAREAGWRPTGDLDKKLGGDFAHARRFARDFGNLLRYVSQRNSWTRWDGVRWTFEGARNAAEQAMADCAKATFVEASAALAEAHMEEGTTRLEAAKQLYVDARQFYKSFVTRMNALKAAQTLPELQVGASSFDSDPMVLGVGNGMLDLKTGMLLPADPARFVSHIAGCSFDPKAACPKFLAFLETVQPDPATRDFIRRAVGYTLSGLVDEEKLFFAHGVGRNGKSVFANILSALLGDYAVTIPPETLMRSHTASAEASRAITRLVGTRLALLNETPADAMWDDARVKTLASRERIAARQLYMEGFDFFPTHKLWIRGNAVPGAQDASDGFWRRMVAFGFSQQIPEGRIIPDLDRRIIAEELPGVLTWALGGCLDWQKTGLQIPAAMAAENRSYRESTDHIGQWIADAAEVDPSSRVAISEAYARFETYCRSAGMKPFARIAFSRHMNLRGFETQKSMSTRFFRGLKLRNVDLEVDEDV